MRTRRGRAAATENESGGSAEAAAEAIQSAAEHFRKPTRTALVEFLHSVARADPEAALKSVANKAGLAPLELLKAALVEGYEPK